MARAAQTDPIRNFKFQVQIIPTGTKLNTDLGGKLSTLGFSVVSGLTVQNEMIAYREGGMNTHPHKMVGQSDFGPVTFTKGVYGHQDGLYKWQQFMHSWGQGALGYGSTEDDNDYRCDIVVKIKDHPVSSGRYDQPGKPDNSFTTPAGKIKMAYKLYNCWPASYSLGDLNAGDSSIMIQQMVVNHEGFQIVWSDSAGGEVSAGLIDSLT